jgi:hypothetical protein
MLDLIYIVDQDFAPSATLADSTCQAQNTGAVSGDAAHSQKTNRAAVVARSAVKILDSVNPYVLPTGLLISAMQEIPKLAAMFYGDDSLTDEPKDNQQAQTTLLSAYLKRHSITRSMAKESGYCFQPGHPVVGKTYRKHPLAEYSNTDHQNLYIPSDSYDAILLEERESELLKLLVHLGATKITITKKATDDNHSKISASLSAQVGPLGGAELGYTGSSQSATGTLDTREFSLSGRPWNNGSTVEKDQFFWLSFEPSWKAVVFAREHGGCLTASLEIKESTSFSTDKNLEMSVKAKQIEVGAQASAVNVGNQERTYFVRVEFSPIHQVP